MLSGWKAEPLWAWQSECTPPDLLCITRPHCAGDIMTYKRKRVEKIPPVHLHRGRTDSRALWRGKRVKKNGGPMEEGEERSRQHASDRCGVSALSSSCWIFGLFRNGSGVDYGCRSWTNLSLPFLNVTWLPGHIQHFRLVFCNLLLFPYLFSIYFLSHMLLLFVSVFITDSGIKFFFSSI